MDSSICAAVIFWCLVAGFFACDVPMVHGKLTLPIAPLDQDSVNESGCSSSGSEDELACPSSLSDLSSSSSVSDEGSGEDGAVGIVRRINRLLEGHGGHGVDWRDAETVAPGRAGKGSEDVSRASSDLDDE